MKSLRTVTASLAAATLVLGATPLMAKGKDTLGAAAKLRLVGSQIAAPCTKQPDGTWKRPTADGLETCRAVGGPGGNTGLILGGVAAAAGAGIAVAAGGGDSASP